MRNNTAPFFIEAKVLDNEFGLCTENDCCREMPGTQDCQMMYNVVLLYACTHIGVL